MFLGTSGRFLALLNPERFPLLVRNVFRSCQKSREKLIVLWVHVGLLGSWRTESEETEIVCANTRTLRFLERSGLSE